MKTSNINELKSIYPQLNAPQVSRRSLLALGSIFALELAGCGGRGHDESNTPAPPSYINAGVVTTLAGSLTAGNLDGTGSAARFSGPTELAVDANGTVYVSDNKNYLIRKITSAGVVTTLAGSGVSGYQDGTGSAAQFGVLTGIAVDANGTVYVADSSNHVIRKITPAGVVTTFAGSLPGGYVDGAADIAQFSFPRGVAIDSAGNLYVTDCNNNLIRKITAAGEVTTFAGTQGVFGVQDGTGVTASFASPWGITIDANGNLFVTDNSSHRIRKITSAGVVTTVAGDYPSGYADGVGSAAHFKYPEGISVDSSGNLYVADSYNSLIRKIVISTGTVTSFAGTTTSGYTDATGSAARFQYPEGVVVGSNGYIYVADTYNNMIRKIT